MKFEKEVKLNTGATIPILGLGTWQSAPGEVEAAVKHALKVGYRHIDAAAVYGNETEVGQALKEAMAELGIPRSEIFVTSKLWCTSFRPELVEAACRKTLADLGLKYLDLYLVHWPVPLAGGGSQGDFPKNDDGTFKVDDEVHPTTTWLAVEKLVDLGLCKAIGLSNFNSEQIQDVLDKGKIVPANNQVECHPYFNQSKLVKFCADRGITVTAYAPLGSPKRPSWLVGADNGVLLEDPEVLQLAKKKGKTPAQILIRFQLERGVITVPKSVNPARIEENFDVFDFSLDEEDMKVLFSLDRKLRLFKNVFENSKHYPFNLEF